MEESKTCFLKVCNENNKGDIEITLWEGPLSIITYDRSPEWYEIKCIQLIVRIHYNSSNTKKEWISDKPELPGVKLFHCTNMSSCDNGIPAEPEFGELEHPSKGKIQIHDATLGNGRRVMLIIPQ